MADPGFPMGDSNPQGAREPNTRPHFPENYEKGENCALVIAHIKVESAISLQVFFGRH